MSLTNLLKRAVLPAAFAVAAAFSTPDYAQAQPTQGAYAQQRTPCGCEDLCKGVDGKSEARDLTSLLKEHGKKDGTTTGMSYSLGDTMVDAYLKNGSLELHLSDKAGQKLAVFVDNNADGQVDHAFFFNYDRGSKPTIDVVTVDEKSIRNAAKGGQAALGEVKNMHSPDGRLANCLYEGMLASSNLVIYEGIISSFNKEMDQMVKELEDTVKLLDEGGLYNTLDM